MVETTTWDVTSCDLCVSVSFSLFMYGNCIKLINFPLFNMTLSNINLLKFIFVLFYFSYIVKNNLFHCIFSREC